MQTPLMRDKNITALISNFIAEGITSFSGLDDMDKEELLVMAMSGLRDEAITAITHADDVDSTLKYLMRFIHRGGIDNALTLAETMRDNAMQYFSEQFETIFNELKESHE